MNWKFWENKQAGKLSKPRDLPSNIGRYLVVNLKYDPDWVWHLKILTRPKEENKNAFDFKIYDPDTASEKGIRIADITSFETHEGLVLFDGWFVKGTEEKLINDHCPG